MSATIGAGSAGTCFSGGTGSGGTANPTVGTTTGNGEENGGQGGASNGVGFGNYMAGAGNPNGDDGTITEANGTGGTLIVIVEGSITLPDSLATYFTADGVSGLSQRFPVNYGTAPYGGGSGGGIVLVVAQNGASLNTTNVTARGGTAASKAKSGGDGAAVGLNMSAFNIS